MMTVEERKRGLRAAVNVKDRHKREALLWEIIDSLVEEADNLGAEILAVASDAGVYDGDSTESAIACIRTEFSGYSKLMWELQRICNADSARPDDVLAGITKLRDELNAAREQFHEAHAILAEFVADVEAVGVKAWLGR